MNSNLVGRLKNTSLPASKALFPVLEAVVNSIHAIEERNDLSNMGDGEIIVDVIRGSSLPNSDIVGDVVDVVIKDNGVGFTDDNIASFKMLDSEYKASRGGRGVGRLLWLKAFNEVSIESCYKKNDGCHLRSLRFSATKGVEELSDIHVANTNTSTEVRLSGLKKSYLGKIPKSVEVIARMILEHCLWYYIRTGGAPRIVVKDGDKCCSLDEMYEEYSSTQPDRFDFKIRGNKFDVCGLKLRADIRSDHAICFCADQREVREEKLDALLPALSGGASDAKGKFFYRVYVTGAYLDECVRSERTDFNLGRDDSSAILPGMEAPPSLGEIRDKVVEYVKQVLSVQLKDNVDKSVAHLKEFVENEAPQYRPVLGRVLASGRYISPTASKKELDLELHKESVDLEHELREEGHDVLVPKVNEGVDVYEERVKGYVSRITEISKSKLIDYVVHRRAVIDVLQSLLERNTEGKYALESMIHELIFPMQKISDNLIHCDEANLWLLDERLSFHYYLASDKTLNSMPDIDSNSGKEPDLLVLKKDVFSPMLVCESEAAPYSTLSVVEFKRPMRDKAENKGKDPVEQVFEYLDKIRAGKAKTVKGRPIPAGEYPRTFCYIICDVLDSMRECAKKYSLSETEDGLGYVGYHSGYKVMLFVVSYDQMLRATKERHLAFFDKLGLPTK